MVAMRSKAEALVRTVRRSQSGFTLIETMVATLVLTVGVLALAGMLADGLAYMSMSQMDYIAQQKATEAVESIFTARDMGQATWDSICNVGSSLCSGGIFINGAQPLCDPGTDGIIGTADDFAGSGCAGGTLGTDSILLPTSAGVLNSTTANRVPLTSYNFLRTITITAAPNALANLRKIQVTITYQAGRFSRTYTMSTYISNFS
jgi:prepilin-type N-terminal cleavage/methylation domain-containing protein